MYRRCSLSSRWREKHRLQENNTRKWGRQGDQKASASTTMVIYGVDGDLESKKKKRGFQKVHGPPENHGAEICQGYVKRGFCLQWAERGRCPFAHPAKVGSSFATPIGTDGRRDEPGRRPHHANATPASSTSRHPCCCSCHGASQCRAGSGRTCAPHGLDTADANKWSNATGSNTPPTPHANLPWNRCPFDHPPRDPTVPAVPSTTTVTLPDPPSTDTHPTPMSTD